VVREPGQEKGKLGSGPTLKALSGPSQGMPWLLPAFAKSPSSRSEMTCAEPRATEAPGSTAPRGLLWKELDSRITGFPT
jgi:hypothetical protein